MTEVEQLVKMANQIAQNFSFNDDAIERVADHLQRFWAPSMLQSLADVRQQGHSGLSATVVAAIEQLGLA